MKVLRAVQVINRDGGYGVSSTYNELDGNGNVTKLNEKDSFFAIDQTLIGHIEAIEQYIRQNRLSE